MAAAAEHRFTVIVRLPFRRGDFVDPPPVVWNAAKEKELWEIISRQSKTNEINWRELADKLEVSQSFLLQQAAWMYEQQLSQVRAQMRRVGSRQSSIPSLGAGSMTGSGLGGQHLKREGSTGSRASSRLSIRNKDFSLSKGEPGGPSAAAAPARPKASQASLASALATRRLSKEVSSRLLDTSNREDDRFLPQQDILQSPKSLHHQASSSSSSSQSENASIPEVSKDKRHIESSTLFRRSQHLPQRLASHVDEDAEDGDNDSDEDGEATAYLPFAASPPSRRQSVQSISTPNADMHPPSTSHRPTTTRKKTSERLPSRGSQPGNYATQQPLSSSASSNSSGPNGQSTPAAPASQRVSRDRASQPPRSTAPLSPRRAAELAATGLSPLRRTGGGKEGSDGSPSMGSSFSDLDDASVTQSALEEALLSNMQHGRDTGMASRMSTISQALRSRVFDPGRKQR